MEIPEQLRELVEQLGQSLVQALANDEVCRRLARKIQEHGFDVALMIEATVALHPRGEEGSPERIEHLEMPNPLELERPSSQWSEEDRAFLRTFKISLD